MEMMQYTIISGTLDIRAGILTTINITHRLHCLINVPNYL